MLLYYKIDLSIKVEFLGELKRKKFISKKMRAMIRYLLGRASNSKFILTKASKKINLGNESYNKAVENTLNYNSDKMNKAMRGLATITTLLVPFPLMTGLWGMNVKVPMKFVTNYSPFFGLLGAMCVMSICIYIFARCVKWI